MFKNLGNIIAADCDLDKIAVIDLSKNTESYTFRQINDKANAVARSLSAKNVKAGDRISILSDNSARLICVFFGSMRLGAVPVLINTKLTKYQIENILEETQSTILFTDQDLAFSIDTIALDKDFENFLDFGNFTCYEPEINDAAFILYTSGSYGNPKGALITHSSHIWAVTRNVKTDIKWSSKRISLIAAPLYHANGLTTFEGSFAGQSTVVLLSKFDAKTCIQAIEHHQVNTLFCVPTMLAMMVKEEFINTANLLSLRQIRSASSHLSEQLANTVKQYFPNANILNSYGITEVGPALFGPHPKGLPRPATSVGYPAQGIDYNIINGILQIKSPSMMKSYKDGNRDGFTDDGYFITKDLFRVDKDGFYYFLGRSDDMFKCGGNSVYPNQVEAILESHPSILSAFVLGIEDNIKGFKPYAFVVLNKNCTASEAELKQYVLSRGPAYQHPRKVWILEKMPLAGTNKINKKELERTARNFLATE